MRRLIALASVFALVSAADAASQARGAGPARAQARRAQGRGRAAGPSTLVLRFEHAVPPARPGGIWTPNGNGFGGGGRCRDCGDRGFSLEFPVFTPAGPGGVRPEHPVLRPCQGQRRREGASGGAHRPASRAASGAGQRHLWHLQSDGDAACGPVSRSRRIDRAARSHPAALPVGIRAATIWMDGRKLPAPDDIDIPRWWGYAVGRWDGNTLVVESTGYDERTWVDHFGYPHSDEMVLRGTLHAHNYDTIELKMTLTDPKYYAKPWTARPSACTCCRRRSSSRRDGLVFLETSARRPTSWSSTGSSAIRQAPASRPSLERR